MTTLSKQDLISFLDRAGERGMMKQTTARSLRSACTTVLSVLDEQEAVDILAVDLDSVFERYENQRRMDISSATMQAYKRRVGYAIEEYLKYDSDDMDLKPSVGHMPSAMVQSATRGKTLRHARGQSVARDESRSRVVDAATLTHQFPLRRNAVVTVTGIPFDVKKSEMSRLNAFLSNLVVSAEDEEAEKLSLLQ